MRRGILLFIFMAHTKSIMAHPNSAGADMSIHKSILFRIKWKEVKYGKFHQICGGVFLIMELKIPDREFDLRLKIFKLPILCEMYQNRGIMGPFFTSKLRRIEWVWNKPGPLFMGIH